MCNMLKEHRSENFLTELIEIALLINSNSVISVMVIPFNINIVM